MDIRVTNQPLKLNNKTSFSGSVFEVVFLLIITILAYFYLVAPKSEQYGTLKDQFKALEQKQAELATQKSAFDRLVQQLASEPETVALLDGMLPLDAKPSRLYVLLENLVQSAGLTTGAVTVNADSQVVVAGDQQMTDKPFAVDRTLKPTGITISATGTIDQLSGLLRSIETATRLLAIESLDVSQGRAGQIVFKVGMKAYSYNPDPAGKHAPN